MRKLFTLLFLSVGLLPAAFAQTAVTVTTGQGYQTDVFYSLENGEAGTAPRTEWDLAFMINISSAIRANTAAGTSVFSVPYAQSEWASVDTAGHLTDANMLYDDMTSWGIGALNSTADTSDWTDIGWGTYDLMTHIVTGDSVFVVESVGGNFYKVAIEERASGEYTFRVGTLDGSVDTTYTLDTQNFSDKYFVYLNLDNAQWLDREPVREAWDLLFTQYTTAIPAGPGTVFNYPVSGVLSNPGTEVAVLSPVDIGSTNDTTGAPWSMAPNTIGYDWKAYDMQTATYEIEDSTVYFIKQTDGEVYKVWMTDFGGSGTGEFMFNQEPLGVSSVGEDLNNALELFSSYPNPATDHTNLVIDASRPMTLELQLVTVTGQVVKQQQIRTTGGLQTQRVSLAGLPTGMYHLVVISPEGRHTQKLLVR